MKKRPRITISTTVNLQNYENIRIEVEGNNAEECKKMIVDALCTFGKKHEATRQYIDSYLLRVFGVIDKCRT